MNVLADVLQLNSHAAELAMSRHKVEQLDRELKRQRRVNRRLRRSQRRRDDQQSAAATVAAAHVDILTSQVNSLYHNMGVSSWWSGGSAFASINEVNLRRAPLVLRWATVSGFYARCRTLISACNQPAT